MKVVILNSSIYILYFLLLLFVKKRGSHRLFSVTGFFQNKELLLLLQFSGIVLFALLPLLTLGTGALPFLTSSIELYPLLVTIFLVMLLLVAGPALATKSLRTQFTATDSPVLNRFFLYKFFTSRALFIASYELWFRGILLYELVQVFSLPLAITINIAFYSLVHIPNGKQEAIASIPFGLILCLTCLWSNSVLPAILIHLALTMGYEAGFIYHYKKEKLIYESISNRSVRIPG